MKERNQSAIFFAIFLFVYGHFRRHGRFPSFYPPWVFALHDVADGQRRLGKADVLHAKPNLVDAGAPGQLSGERGAARWRARRLRVHAERTNES